MFKKLKALLFENDVDQKAICELIGKSQTYVTARMMGRKSWELEDVYCICDEFDIPYEQIPILPTGWAYIRNRTSLYTYVRRNRTN